MKAWHTFKINEASTGKMCVEGDIVTFVKNSWKLADILQTRFLIHAKIVAECFENEGLIQSDMLNRT